MTNNESIIEFLKRVNDLEKFIADPKNIVDEKIGELFSLLRLPHITRTNIDNFVFYRARFVEEFKEHFPDQYTYPPDGLRRRNRANLDGFAVFYAAKDLRGAILEALLAEDEEKINSQNGIMYVSKWSERKVGDGYLIWNLTNRVSNNDLEGNIKGKVWCEARNRELEVLSNLFRSPDHYFSSQLGNNVLQRIHLGLEYPNLNNIPKSGLYLQSRPTEFKTDFLIYPSVIKTQPFRNYAFQKDSIDTKFKMDCIFKIKLSSKISKSNILDYGIVFNIISVGEPTADLTRIKFRNFTREDFRLLGLEYAALNWRNPNSEEENRFVLDNDSIKYGSFSFGIF